MKNYKNQIKVVWLLPIAWFYWNPLLSIFTQFFPNTKIFTGLFPGFLKGYENTFDIKQLGKIRFVKTAQKKSYGGGFSYLSPNILFHLFAIKPQLIIADSFRLWTIFAVLFKPLFQWKIILLYEGSSPNVDYKNSFLRLLLRRFIVKNVNYLLTNSNEGKNYLVTTLNAKENFVQSYPYEVPVITPLQQSGIIKGEYNHPIFFFAGHIIARKGIEDLINAIITLQNKGIQNYSVLIAGDGPDLPHWEKLTSDKKLPIKWLGKIAYETLGTYYKISDVFVYPSLEDTWGVAVLEAMLFGKAVLCSSAAGSSELVENEVSGLVFPPQKPQVLASHMQWCLENPQSVRLMGLRSAEIMKKYESHIIVDKMTKIINGLTTGKL